MKYNSETIKENQGLAVKFMRFAFFIAAPFLLFNPIYAIIDPLPDFLGYIFICIALSKLRDVNSHLESSAVSFIKLAVVDALKIPAVLLVFGWVTLEERATMLLLCCFVFAVGELILITGAWNNFFEGLTEFSQMHGGHAVLRGNKTVRIRNATVFFFFLKEALTVLPEAAVLTSHGYDEGRLDISEFASLFRVMAGFIIIIAGVIWLVRITAYLIKLGKDSEFFADAAAVYHDSIEAKPGVLIRRSIGAAVWLVTAVLVLSFDFTVDGVGIIPDTLAALTAVFAFLKLRQFSRFWKAGAACSAAMAVFSALGWFFSYRFHSVYSDFEVQRSSNAFNAFMKFYPFVIVSNLLAVAVSLLIFLCCKSIVDSHCGYVSMNASDEYRAAKLAEIKKGLYIRLAVCAFFTVLSGISGIVFPYIITFKNLVIGEIWWLIDAVISGAALAAWISTSFAVTAEADSKYMLD